ncbi:MAG TPA: choice-of-anchor Q domain-containing protein [Candidatus Acidoferrum sp.]|nr:choice-of-anchor Q domain-containing protein [Candidatus Acidoferrum sp.]
MIGASGTSAVYCYTSLYETTPIFTNNDAYSPNGAGLTGSCASQSGQTGNLSVNPMFVAAANFRLKAGSPAIDAGDNAAPDLPPLDLAGKPRAASMAMAVVPRLSIWAPMSISHLHRYPSFQVSRDEELLRQRIVFHLQHVGLAADLTILNVGLPASRRIIDRSDIPLATPCALKTSFHAEVPCNTLPL